MSDELKEQISEILAGSAALPMAEQPAPVASVPTQFSQAVDAMEMGSSFTKVRGGWQGQAVRSGIVHHVFYADVPEAKA